MSDQSTNDVVVPHAAQEPKLTPCTEPSNSADDSFEPGLGYGRFLSITRKGAVARFAGMITGLEPFSAVLRALEQLDPQQPATIDLRAVTDADRHNLCSISVWMLRRFARQHGPVRLLLNPGPVAEMMLTVLSGKPRSVGWDPQQLCLVVNMETTPAAATLLGQLETVADSL